MSSNYRGMRVMDPLDPPNVPTDIRSLVASGPIPRFGSISEMAASLQPGYAGMLAAVGEIIYRFNGATWIRADPPAWKAIGGPNVGSESVQQHELNRMFLEPGCWRINAAIVWDGPNGMAFDGYLFVGPNGSIFQQRVNVYRSGFNTEFLGGLVNLPGGQDMTIFVTHFGGPAATFRGDLWANCIQHYTT